MFLNSDVWRRLLRVLWTAKRSNQSILKEINPEYSLEGLMLKLKLRYFDHLMSRTDSLEKTLMLWKIEGGKRSGRQRMRWLDGITDSMDVSEWTPGVGDGQGGLACCDSWGRKELDTTKWLNWTEASFNFMAAVTIWSDFGAPQNKVCHCFHCFPWHGTGCHDLYFLNVEFCLRQLFHSSLSLSSRGFLVPLHFLP